MVLIFGTGKQFFKELGRTQKSKCIRCRNKTSFSLVKGTKWLTFFLIPLIPYSITYYLFCDICSTSFEITKDELYRCLYDNLDPYNLLKTVKIDYNDEL